MTVAVCTAIRTAAPLVPVRHFLRRCSNAAPALSLDSVPIAKHGKGTRGTGPTTPSKNRWDVNE